MCSSDLSLQLLLELGKRRIEEQLERELGMKDRLEVQQAIAELQLDYRRGERREGGRTRREPAGWEQYSAKEREVRGR